MPAGMLKTKAQENGDVTFRRVTFKASHLSLSAAVMTVVLRSARSLDMDENLAASRRETLNLQIKPETRSLIEQAARATGKTGTDFVLDAARRAAEEALLDRTVISASPESYAAFLARLDAPAQPNDRLRRTLQTPPVRD